jgi:hypothetical protein
LKTKSTSLITEVFETMKKQGTFVDMKSKYLFLLVLVFVLVGFYADAQGCSQCKMLAEQGSEVDEASFGSNINKGILYLMAIPYVLLFLLFRKRLVALFKRK